MARRANHASVPASRACRWESILSPEDVARAAVYLVSDDSEGITGVLHVIDGGLLAASEYNVPL